MGYGRSLVLAGLMMGLAGLASSNLGQWDLAAVAQTVEPPQTEADVSRAREAQRLWEQGRDRYKLGQFEAASQSWGAALRLYRELKDRRHEAQVLGNLGLAYDELKNYPKSIEFYQQNLALTRALKDLKGERRALVRLGMAYNALKNYPKSLEFYEQGLAVIRVLKDRKGEAAALFMLGLGYDSMGNYPKAIEWYGQNLALVRELQDRGSEALALRGLGNAYGALGNHPKAIEFHEKSLKIAQELQDSDGEGRALNNLGNAYNSLGNYGKAIELYEKGLIVTRAAKDREVEASILGNLGVAYHSLGSYVKSIQAQEQRLAISQARKDPISAGQSLFSIGNVYNSLKNYPKAIEFYEQSLAIAREHQDRQHEGMGLGNLGAIYTELGDYTKAFEFYEKSLTIAREIGDRDSEGVMLFNLGRINKGLGNKAKAIEFYEQSLAIARETKDRDGERKVLNNIGSVLAKQAPELAIVFYKQSINIAESIRRDNLKIDRKLQDSYTEIVSITYRSLADLLLGQGRVLEAQQVLELLKIQELRDTTHDTRAGGDITQGSPLIPLEQSIPAAFNDKIAFGNRLTQCDLTKCPQRSQLIAQREAANKAWTQTVDRLVKGIHSQEVKDPAQLQTDRFILAAQKVILANPQNKTVLVYPLVLDDKLWLVWGSQAGKNGIVFDSKEIPIGRKDLSAKVGELQALLARPQSNPQALQRVSQQLYQWLIAPIRPQLDRNGVKQIVFSLDRATRYIPMAALYDGKQYLVENFALSTILTAEIDTQDKLSPNLRDNPVLGLGLTQKVDGFKPLPAVQTELDSIVQTPQSPNLGIYPGLKLFNNDFTEASFREHIGEYRILHIATHGRFAPDDPANSFLVLGDGKHLSITSIRSITALANTHLVVLSACETGKGGADKEGLEIAGIGHYFLLSGAKSVMASLWQVNDPATSLLMNRFYRNLAPGNVSKAEALRQVQIGFLNGTLTPAEANSLGPVNPIGAVTGPAPIGSFADPYYWAPFILIGNSL
jgi:CHAT domain-containing protein/tetratricopeptide (TPR) repeat protein